MDSPPSGSRFRILVSILVMSLTEAQIKFPENHASVPNIYSDYLDDETPGEREKPMDASEKLQNCGSLNDFCPIEAAEKPKLGSTDVPGQQKLPVNYKTFPNKCRCDRNCVKYGDCCVSVFLNGTKNYNTETELNGRSSLLRPPLLRHNPWKCNYVENHGGLPVWAQMISSCPPKTPDSETSSLCTGEKDVRARMPNSRQYLFDLPVYSIKNRTFYRNIYCARCHEERTEAMLHLTLHLVCSSEFTPEKQASFLENASYLRSDRIWKLGNATCRLIVKEFSAQNLQLNVPGIRYCVPESIDTCPESSNVTRRTRSLCSSYTQYVTTINDDRIFKNPHCYLCHVDRSESKATPRCYYPFLKNFMPTWSVEGAGLNFLFDFNLSTENQWVGYEMLCRESEVWDYVRQQCHPMLCGKGHVLIDEACEPIETLNRTGKGRDDFEEGPEDVHEPTKDLSQEPKCFRILINENEYMFLEDPFQNSTLAVNLSTGGWLYLSSNEYEIYNETTVSICAKDLHRAFESRFSPAFSYLSVGLMGLSVAFLFLHIFLYIMLPKLRNLPSKNLFCLTLCLFLSQLLLLIFFTATQVREICVTAAISIHYFFLGAFFWMSAMGFDIWRTFSGQNLMRTGRESGRRGSFIKYSIFSWGGPFVIVSLAVIADFALDYGFLEDFQPKYGQTGLCWISQRLPLFLYFALPVGLLIFSNLVLFSLTARTILIQKQESNRVLSRSNDSSKSNNGKNAGDEALLKLYVKLALIMGLTWILGFISGFLLWDWLWYAFVVLNGLQGTFIFFAFDFKRRTLDLLKERLGIQAQKESVTTGSSGGKSEQSRPATSTSSTNMSNNLLIKVLDTRKPHLK